MKKLDCSENPSLINIPRIKGIREVLCWNCPLLLNITLDEELECLDCNKCTWVKCAGSEWLNNRNIEYDDNIKILIILQKWFKQVLTSKRLIKLIPLLMPLYYHPQAKGGYLHKKNMLIEMQWI